MNYNGFCGETVRKNKIKDNVKRTDQKKLFTMTLAGKFQKRILWIICQLRFKRARIIGHPNSAIK